MTIEHVTRHMRSFAAHVLAAALLVLVATGAHAEQSAASLDREIQDLKKEVLELNRDMFILEEELLFPSNTQVSVFVSMDVGEFFSLDAVQLLIDNKAVANHLYTEREIGALRRGGVQRLYLGNLSTGKHELTAFFTGLGKEQRPYKRGTTLVLEKGLGPKYVELRITDSEAKLQPEFAVREWE